MGLLLLAFLVLASTLPRSAAAEAMAAAEAVAADETVRIRSGGPFDIEAPASLLLGRDGKATVTFRTRGDERPLLRTNVGTLSAPVAGPGGRLEVTYTPPAARFPQVAIIALSDRDGVTADFVPILLHGQGKVDVVTKPSADAVLEVAGRRYGPFRADAAGALSATVQAPPGVDHGLTKVTDRMGNTKDVRFELNAPRFGKLATLCPNDTGSLLIFAVDAAGRPAVGQAFELEASEGALGLPEMLAPGVYRSAFSAEEVEDRENLRLTARLAGDSISVATCRTIAPGELPVGMEVTMERASYRAGSRSPVAVTVALRYPGKKPPRRVGIELTSDLGELSSPERIDRTRYSGRLTLPETWNGRAEAVVKARTRSGPELESEAVITLEPGPVARVDVASRRPCSPSSGDTFSIVARAYDAFDNPTSGTLAATSGGELTAFSSAGAGTYRATYRAPSGRAGSHDRIVVRDGPGEVAGSVDIALPPRPERVILSASMGYLTNGGRISAPLFSAAVQVPLRRIDERLSVGFQTAYFNSSNGNASKSVSGVPVLLRASYRIAGGPESSALGPRGGCPPRAGLYLGAGAGVMSARTRYASPGREGDGALRGHGAVAGHLGMDLEMGPGRLTFESGYWHASPTGSMIRGNLAGSSLSVGYRAEF